MHTCVQVTTPTMLHILHVCAYVYMHTGTDDKAISDETTAKEDEVVCMINQ